MLVLGLKGDGCPVNRCSVRGVPVKPSSPATRNREAVNSAPIALFLQGGSHWPGDRPRLVLRAWWLG